MGNVALVLKKYKKKVQNIQPEIFPNRGGDLSRHMY
jgi:hypothetical protein